jgi:hypothetical protein
VNFAAHRLQQPELNMLNLHPRAGVADAANTTVDNVRIIDVVRAPCPHSNLTLSTGASLHSTTPSERGGGAAAARVLGIESLSKHELSRVSERPLTLTRFMREGRSHLWLSTRVSWLMPLQGLNTPNIGGHLALP